MNDEENSKEENASEDDAARLKVRDLEIDAGVFRIVLRDLRRSAEGMREIIRTVNKVASDERLGDFRQWYSNFAKDVERINAATRRWVEVQRELQQAGQQFRDEFKSFRESLAGNKKAVDQLSAALAGLISSAEVAANIELPPPDVVGAAFTDALLAALEEEPTEDEETQEDDWFIASILAKTWTKLNERGFTQSEIQIILLIVANCIFHFFEPALPTIEAVYTQPAPLRSAVESESKLRSEARDTAQVEALLKPGQDVEHLDEKEGWIRVRLLDKENEEYRIGWVKKEDLIPIEEER